MRKVLLVIAVCLLPGSAHASVTAGCQAPDHFDPTSFACSKTFVARHKPQRYRAFGPDRPSFVARWAVDNRQFLAMPKHRPWCRMYGRYGPVRVRQNSCNGLTISVRSVGPPTEVTFEWEAVR